MKSDDGRDITYTAGPDRFRVKVILWMTRTDDDGKRWFGFGGKWRRLKSREEYFRLNQAIDAAAQELSRGNR